jgi:hypothetical protein
MHKTLTGLTSTLKTIVISTLTFFTLYSFQAFAWTAPSGAPTSGNVAGPITTSATAQTKAGGLTVGGLTLPAGSTINGGGSNTTYGSLTMSGSKNGWSGINFPGSGTLMMHPSYSGFYNAADNAWRYYVTDAGASYQPGIAGAADFCINGGGKCLSAAGGGTGMRGVYLPLAGKTISCVGSSGYNASYYAKVDSTGQIYTRAAGRSGGIYTDTGWVAAYSSEAGVGIGSVKFTSTASLDGLVGTEYSYLGGWISDSSGCSVPWPQT